MVDLTDATEESPSSWMDTVQGTELQCITCSCNVFELPCIVAFEARDPFPGLAMSSWSLSSRISFAVRSPEDLQVHLQLCGTGGVGICGISSATCSLHLVGSYLASPYGKSAGMGPPYPRGRAVTCPRRRPVSIVLDPRCIGGSVSLVVSAAFF